MDCIFCKNELSQIDDYECECNNCNYLLVTIIDCQLPLPA